MQPWICNMPHTTNQIHYATCNKTNTTNHMQKKTNTTLMQHAKCKDNKPHAKSKLKYEARRFQIATS